MSRRYRHRGWVDRSRPRVLDVAPGLVHESGPLPGLGWAPDRVAVMAHWSTSAEPSRSVVSMLRELDSAGYETVLVSASEVAGPIGRVCTWAPGQPELPDRTTVLRRANVGYDFGSWASVLAAYPGVRAAPQVLLVNDSLIGPFAPLDEVLADFEACSTPVWGLSGSLQHRRHLQSFFVGYEAGILDSPSLRGFWSDIRVESRKAKIVRFNELALSEVLDSAGIGWSAMYSPQPGGPPNPTIDDWERLLAEGFPFLKAEVVLDPPEWLEQRREIETLASSALGQSVRDWTPIAQEPTPRSRPPGSAGRSRQVGVIIDIDGVGGLLRAGLTRSRHSLGGHRG